LAYSLWDSCLGLRVPIFTAGGVRGELKPRGKSRWRMRARLSGLAVAGLGPYRGLVSLINPSPAFLPEAPDLPILGLALAILGCFLLANSIVFRHPRVLVSEFFGGEEKRLTTIRAYIFHRVQIHLGFLFLLLGFGLQLFGRLEQGAGEAARDSAEGGASSGFPLEWLGFMLLAVGVLEILGWWLSHALFRRYVRLYFRVHPPALEADMALARELGELFGIRSEGDDSVQSYLLRIRQRIGILGTGSMVRAQGINGGPEEEEAEREFGVSAN
jgi:hypothetical protein